MDYGNTKTPSIHRRFGSATLSLLALPGERNRISHGRNPSGTIQLLQKKKGFSDGVAFHCFPSSDFWRAWIQQATLPYTSDAYFGWGAGTACWLGHRGHDRKAASSSPGRTGGRIFFSSVNVMCWLLFRVRSMPVLPQWHVKNPGHCTRSAGGRLHPHTHTPLTQRSRSELTMPLSRHSVGTCQ